FRIKDFTYITDASHIEECEINKIKGTKVLVINALRKTTHLSHFSLPEALEVIAKVKPQNAYITHIGHEMGFHAETDAELPDGVHLAYDGLRVEF
ncbi:MAG: MBL fold metallo-hydrolase, partial [Bacteroidales bacterium]|nr:MBL fold metallo-hydrolase [Bacteroidales bacterium]